MSGEAETSDLRSRTRFDPADVEPRIARRWLDEGLHHPEPAGTPDENYSIAVPPPNVTGALHMGHALNGTIQDVLIRTHRMRGQRTKWILGTDHAGIATQRQVEKRLEAQGTSREELGREAFTARRLGVAGGVRRADHRAVQAPRRAARLRRRALHDGRRVRPCRAEGLRRPLRAGPHLPRHLHGQLGSRPAARRSPTSRSRTAKASPTRCTRSPTRSRTATARWSSRPCARRRCSPTPRSPCIPTTSATSTSSGAR